MAATRKSKNIKNTLPFKPVGGMSNQSRIEVLDLTNKGQEPEQSDYGGKGSAELYELYSSAARRSPQFLSISNTLTAKTQVEQTQQHLSSTIEVESGYRDGTPNEFEASWMDDFPSPSAATKEMEEELYTSRQASINRREAVETHAPFIIGSQTPVKYNKLDRLQDPQTNSSGYGNQEGSLGYRGPENTTCANVASQHYDLFSSPTQSKAMPVSSGSRRETRDRELFLPTSSPEKMPVIFEDPDTLASAAKDTSMEPPSKRQRFDDQDMSQQLLDNQIAQQLRSSSNAENHRKRLDNLRKRLPWDDIEGIDLEFLLDYADIVEFV